MSIIKICSNENASIFKALCDSNRLLIIDLLQSGEKCACVLMENVDIAQSSLSYHMKILCESKIVTCRQEGKWTYYKISQEGIEKAINVLKSIKVNS